MTTRRSEELYRRALDLLPGGVNSPVRAMRQIGRDPIFIAAAEGCELVDADGNRYVDWVGSWGPAIVGHADPAVVEAVRDAAGRGTSFGAPTEAEVELAAEVASRFDSIEMSRMTSSGTEAAMTAIRIARAFTGRDAIFKFAGCYHGHSDGLLAEGGSGLATEGIPASPGVPEAVAATTITLPWNDREALDAALDEHEPAAILAEPIPANMGVVPPAGDFVSHLRRRADDSGALLILDEVITGFRVARGGAQELQRVGADLTVLGKVLGGGLPAAAVGGSAALLNQLAPAGPVYQAGTLSGNPLATAAGLATLRQLDQGAYTRLNALTNRLADGLQQIGDATAVPFRVQSECGLLTPFFSGVPVVDFEAAKAADTAAYGRFCRALLDRGVYAPPSPFEAWFVSLAHDEEAVDRTLSAASEALVEAAG